MWKIVAAIVIVIACATHAAAHGPCRTSFGPQFAPQFVPQFAPQPFYGHSAGLQFGAYGFQQQEFIVQTFNTGHGTFGRTNTGRVVRPRFRPRFFLSF